ncbi:ABC transporter, ATP-binding protein [Lachnospiraceae bacterium KM106-2]|nr:ABC transporter, ATP-binding protein [Lachnospiraceae bacterium KM106-2]
MIVATVYPFLSVILPKVLITEFMKGDNASTHYLLTVVAGYFILASLFGFAKNLILNCGYPILTNFRMELLRDTCKKLLTMDYPYHEDSIFFEEHERAIEATSNNADGLEGVSHDLFEMPYYVLVVLLLSIFIGRQSILILIGLLGSIAVTLQVARMQQKYEYSKKKPLAKADRKKSYYNKVTHDFGYGKDIRIYGFEKRILHNYKDEIKNYGAILRMIKNREYALGFLELAALLISDGLTYGLLIYYVVNGMSIADFSMYLTAITMLSTQLKQGMEKVVHILKEGQYVYDYFSFIEDPSFIKNKGTRKAIQGDTLEITFKDVSFKYPKTDKYILNHLNFTIHKGEKLAIVGINGAGKTTIVKLITGMFEPTSGEILVNGIPIQEFDKEEYYSMFSAVFQDINVMAFTIGENLSCRLGEVNEAKAMDCLERVGLGDKVKGFEKKLDQMMLKVIDPEGTDFSGGERQKLSIARALYKDANMVILDEPTAALDALAEAEIYEGFNDLVSHKTAVYISHRLASTKFCDKIALFDENGLREYGTHDELMAKKGTYYDMFVVQGKYYQEGGDVA